MPTSALLKNVGILRADVGIGPYVGTYFNRVNNNLCSYLTISQKIPKSNYRIGKENVAHNSLAPNKKEE